MRTVSLAVGLALLFGANLQVAADKIVGHTVNPIFNVATVSDQSPEIEADESESADAISDSTTDDVTEDETSVEEQSTDADDQTTEADSDAVETSAETDKPSADQATVADDEDKGAEGSDEASASEADESLADDANEPATQEDIQGLRSDIETLRDQWNRTLTRNSAQSSRNLLVSGIVQTRYTKSWNPTSPSTFDIPLFILNFSGNLKKDYEQGKNFNYFVGLSSTGTADSYRFKPLDAYITYSFSPTVDTKAPQLSFIFGQQKKQFGLEPLTTEDNQPAIKPAMFANNLGLSARDIGFTLKGDLQPFIDYGTGYRVPLVEYAIGVFNGSGANAVDTDNNKDLVGRVVLNAPSFYNSPLRGLSVGSSFYRGKKSLSLGNGAKDRKDLFLSYVRSPIGITAEYVNGEDGNVVGGALKGIKSKGRTISFFYSYGDQFVKGFRNQTRYDDWWPQTFQPFVRFDWYDPNTAVKNNEQSITTIGFNWFFAQTTKFQINYNIKRETPSVKNNELLVQYQFGF